MLDSPIRDLTPEEAELRAKAAAESGPPRVYPTVEAAVARFRLVPPQDAAEPYVFDHIARTSLKQTAGERGDAGYSWKFDTLRMGREGRRSLEAMRPRCRLAYFRCEHGIVSDELMARLRQQFGGDALVAELPAAGHHPMIDQPIAVVAAVRTVLAAWRY